MKPPVNSRFLPRKQPQQARSKALVTAILDAAAQVLIRDGYADTTTNMIAAQAGVSIGSLYEYYPAKEAIFAQLAGRLTQQMYDIMLAHIADMSQLSPKQAIERVVEARVLGILVNPTLYVSLKNKVPRQITAEHTDELLESFQAICIAFLVSNAEQVRSKSAHLVSDVAMRTMYAVIEDLAEFDPDKLRDDDYLHELKHLMCRYILKGR